MAEKAHQRLLWRLRRQTAPRFSRFTRARALALDLRRRAFWVTETRRALQPPLYSPEDCGMKPYWTADEKTSVRTTLPQWSKGERRLRAYIMRATATSVPPTISHNPLEKGWQHAHFHFHDA